MKVLAGSGLVTMASVSMTVIGKAHMAALHTVINGTTIMNATTADHGNHDHGHGHGHDHDDH
jgi:hypothetical protein